MSEKITRELAQPPQAPPALNAELFKPNEAEWAFLHTAVSNDDEEVKRRVIEVQHDAYSAYPYPCIHAFHHVSLMMSRNPIYSFVLKSGKELGENALFLDLGCCMGTDVRKLAADGYPTTRIVAADLRRTFIDLGFKLYGDAATNPIHFFTADILALSPTVAPTDTFVLPSEVEDLTQLVGRVRHLYTGALFHLFDESTQRAIATRLARLLSDAPGSVVFGRHQGLHTAGYIDDHLGRLRYGHSPLSWTALWKEVWENVAGRGTLEVEAEISASPGGLVRPMSGQLVWSVKVT